MTLTMSFRYVISREWSNIPLYFLIYPTSEILVLQCSLRAIWVKLFSILYTWVSRKVQPRSSWVLNKMKMELRNFWWAKKPVPISPKHEAQNNCNSFKYSSFYSNEVNTFMWSTFLALAEPVFSSVWMPSFNALADQNTGPGLTRARGWSLGFTLFFCFAFIKFQLDNKQASTYVELGYSIIQLSVQRRDKKAMITRFRSTS